jgi:hypothetical protein
MSFKLEYLRYLIVHALRINKFKHSLGIALTSKKVDCPPEAKNVPIGERRQPVDQKK